MHYVQESTASTEIIVTGHHGPGTRCTLGDWIQAVDGELTNKDSIFSLDDPGASLAGASVNDRM